MSESGSDIEIKSALSKKRVKLPGSPSDDVMNNNLKKTTTKTMIKDALTELKTRKGVSVYAIKKFLTEKYQMNTEKLNYLIKKSLKAGVEDGTFIQLKGIGASGSFKLANIKEKVKKPKKKKEPEKGANVKKTKKEPEKDTKEMKNKKTMEKPTEKKPKTKKKDTADESKPSKKKVEVKAPKKTIEKANQTTQKEQKEKKIKAKNVKIAKTPVKKRGVMMKRKSIGSIIKPPKMKPKHS